MIDINDIDGIIKQYNKNNPSMALNPDEQIRAKRLFVKSMKEASNGKLSSVDQESLLTDILFGIKIGEKDQTIFTQHSDIRHLGFFDTFMYEGAAMDIVDALQRNGVSSEILRGIPKGIPYDATINGIDIHIEWESDGDGSPVLTEFSITKDGKTIYEWGGEEDYYSQLIEDDEEEDDWDWSDIDEYIAGSTIKSREVHTPDFSYIEEQYATSSGNKAVRKRYAAGTIINGVKVGGRFIS